MTCRLNKPVGPWTSSPWYVGVEEDIGTTVCDWPMNRDLKRLGPLIFLAVCCFGIASIFRCVQLILTSLSLAVHILDLPNLTSRSVFFACRPCSLPSTIFTMGCFRPSWCNSPVMRKYSYILRGPVYVLRLYAFQGNDKHAGDEWQNMVVFNLRAYFITNLGLGILEPSSNQYLVLVLFSQVPVF